MFNLVNFGLALQAASVGKQLPRDYSVVVTASVFTTVIKVSGATSKQDALQQARDVVTVAFPRLSDVKYKVL